jgi:hypothetical protein
MSAQRAKLLAWGLAALATTLLVGGFGAYLTANQFVLTATDLLTTAITVSFSAVGALVAKRHPGNPIGWIFLGVAVSSGLGGFAHGYAQYRLDGGGAAGIVAGTAATYATVSWIPFVLVPPTFLLLLFPDGHLPSRRWRPVAWAAAAGIAGTLATSWMVPGSLEDFPSVRNPYGIDSSLIGLLQGLAYLVLFAGVIGSAVSVVVRFRRGRQEQRQQIKWLAVAGGVAAVALIVNLAFYDVLGENVANGLIMFGVLGLPAAAGIAVLRHRLYDIDVVINRSLVYGALTATLAVTYLASVLLLQTLLAPLTPSNSLAVAVSTLAVAALFQPARGRIQAIVDRRFYRRKYDAARTLERFGAHLRDEIDLDTIGDELRAVVTDTMQPAHVSFWLREPGAPR